MVMHSNERGECCPRTLVDRKRKRYDNVVEVVVHLHDQPILVPNVRHLHVQLNDVPRALDPVEDEGEFRHHAIMLTKLSLEGLLDREFVGRHRAERVQIAKALYFQC